MPKHLCLQCGGELALSFSPSRMNVANAARTPMTGWRCSTCGATFSTEQLRAAKVKVKPVVPAAANS